MASRSKNRRKVTNKLRFMSKVWYFLEFILYGFKDHLKLLLMEISRQ